MPVDACLLKYADSDILAAMLTGMLGTKRRGRREGVAVRDGSVAQARQEAGLTLAQVAGDKLSRTAIHLVERGHSRPSMETLRHIAHQTRKPLSFFLLGSEPSQFAETEQLQKANQVLAKALAAGDATRDPSVQAKVCMVLGQIEEWCGNARKADEQFGTAIRILSELGRAEQLRDAHMAFAEILDARQAVPRAAHHWKAAADLGKLIALGLDWSATDERRKRHVAEAKST